MKTVIITGANGNLGSAVTKEFLEKAYQVIATVASKEMLADLPQHERLYTAVLNLTDEDATAVFVQQMINKFTVIDAALMLVGGFTPGNIAATSGEDLDKQFTLNFKTAYYVTRPLFQHMIEKGNGRLVYIGARPAIEPAQGKDLVAYGLSKSLLFTLAEYLNEASKGKNVSAAVIAPSTLDTPLNRQSMPGIDPANWVQPTALAEILEFIVSQKGDAMRETIIKVYNNA